MIRYPLETNTCAILRYRKAIHDILYKSTNQSTQSTVESYSRKVQQKSEAILNERAHIVKQDPVRHINRYRNLFIALSSIVFYPAHWKFQGQGEYRKSSSCVITPSGGTPCCSGHRRVGLCNEPRCRRKCRSDSAQR